MKSCEPLHKRINVQFGPLLKLTIRAECRGCDPLEAISEAYSKCFVADFICSVSRTIDDKNNNTKRTVCRQK